MNLNNLQEIAVLRHEILSMRNNNPESGQGSETVESYYNYVIHMLNNLHIF